MGMIEIDENELNATREQASQALPWKEEATRLAEALYHVRPNHPLLRGEIWEPLVKQKERALARRDSDAPTYAFSPDTEAMNAISESR